MNADRSSTRVGDRARVAGSGERIEDEPSSPKVPTAPELDARDLSGVPETMLWPLWNRAVETERPDSLIADPWSKELVDKIDYDYSGHFGKPSPFHAIRARVCDDRLRSFLDREGESGRVIALGEGLDSQRLRTRVSPERWTSVDLPEAVALRAALVPGAAEERTITRSALDVRWLEDVDPSLPTFVTALGLLMYFAEDEVRELLRTLSRKLSRAEVCFDTIPPFFSRKTMRGYWITRNYKAPPMPWGIGVGRVAAFLESAGWTPVQVQTYAEPFPARTRLYWLLGKIPPLRAALAGGLVHARCG